MDKDWELRLAAFEALRKLADASRGPIKLEDLVRGFSYQGHRIPFLNAARGIWRPKILGRSGAALSITTAPPKQGKPRPYDDQVGSDGWFTYHYQREGPDSWDNRAVRNAFEQCRPLIYLHGVVPGLYNAVFPVYVQADDIQSRTFSLAADVLTYQPISTDCDPRVFETRRAYTTATVKVRLHQSTFREIVVQAYRTTCAVCRIRHDELLDAAHIIEDRDERGRPEIPNGLSLCKIHHAAYDSNILGISPDRIIHIRHDILEEIDGPMLQHGLKEMDHEKLTVPKSPCLHPNPDYLAVRFDRFRAA